MAYGKLMFVAVTICSCICAQENGTVSTAPQAHAQVPVAPQMAPVTQTLPVKQAAQVPVTVPTVNTQQAQNVVSQAEKTVPAVAQPNMPVAQPAPAAGGLPQAERGTPVTVPTPAAVSAAVSTPPVQQAASSTVPVGTAAMQSGQSVAQTVATVQEHKEADAKKNGVENQHTSAQPEAPQAHVVQPIAPESIQSEKKPALPGQTGENKQSEQPVVEEEKLVGLEPEGIDTLDIQGGGNWLLKRGWWEQAERRYEKTKALLDQIMDARMPFFEKRTDYDRNVLDPFYGQIGLDQGRLEETLSFLNDEINQEREKEGTLNEEQRAFLNTLAEQKKALEQLALDVAAINKLDHQVDAVIERLLDQVNKARGYEKQSWGAFKEIARELSDEKARDLAGAMEAYYKYMEDIKTYIAQDLMQFYLNLMDEGVKQIEQIKSEMQALREKGIDIKSQSERMHQQEALLDKQQSEEEKEAEIKKATEAAKKSQMGFFGTAFSYIIGFFKAIGGFIGWIFSSIYSAIMGLFGRK